MIDIPPWPESLSIADLSPEMISPNRGDLGNALNRAAVAEANLQQMKAFARILVDKIKKQEHRHEA